MKRLWIICLLASIGLTASAEQVTFLKEAQNYYAHNYAHLLHEIGFSYIGDNGNAIIMQGAVDTQPNCTIIIQQQDEYICHIILFYPKRTSKKELAADYKRARNHCIAEFGKPANDKKGECTWQTNDISVVVFCHEDGNAVISYDIIANELDETESNAEDRARKQQIAQAIKERRYNEVLKITKSVSDLTKFRKDYGFATMDDVLDFAQTTRSKTYDQYTRRKVLRYLAEMMILGGNAVFREDESKNIDAQICYQFALTVLASYYKQIPDKYDYIALRFGGFDQIKPKRRSRYYEYEERTMKALVGENSIDYISSLRMLAMAYQKEGKDVQSIDAFQRLLPLMTNYLGPAGYEANKIIYYQAYNSLSVSYSNIGDLKNEEIYDLKTLELSQEIFGDTKPEHATSLMNIGSFYERIGEIDKAIYYTKQAIAIYERTDSKPDKHLIAMQNIMLMLAETGEYVQAELYGQKALALCQKEFGNSSMEYAKTLLSTSYIYVYQKDYPKVREYLLAVAQILQSKPEWKNSRDYAIVLGNLAYTCTEEKDLESALNYQQQAYQLYQQMHYAEEFTNMMLSMNNLGNIYSEMGQNEKAHTYLIRTRDLFRSQYSKSLDFLTERQRQIYWNTIKRKFEEDYPKFSYRYYPQKKDIAAYAYDNELFLKGLLLHSSDAVKRSIYGSGDKQLIDEYEQLKQIKTDMSQSEGNAERTKQLSLQADSLEKEITKHSAAFRRNEELWRIDWKQVQQHLQTNEAAVEFSRIAFDDSVMYAALLLKKESPYPQMISLFEEKQIDNQSNNIWKKLSPYMQGITTIYFAAAGGLHQLPIEYAPYDANSTWSDHYDIVRLSSTRELAMPHEESQVTSATLFGGIYYDVDIAELSAQSESYRSMDMAVSRSLEINDTTLRAGVRYLPGTKREVEEINTILQPQHVQTSLYTASVANEESFKALNGQKQNIIHIATHGFYWSDAAAHKQRYFTQRAVSMGQMEEVPAIDPLNRSGLLFAGANLALRGHSDELPENVQDGILTAKEISLLDLSNAQLVVLSACETGKGEVTGEGVFGLQRAFKMAGAKTILMTLWQVNDDATRMFMTAFFRLYGQGMSKREAFRKAQREVRTYSVTEQRTVSSPAGTSAANRYKNKGKATDTAGTETETIVTHPYSAPYYWAGFILLD